jgi:diguanylate cyclase (GGDEF)-like protein
MSTRLAAIGMMVILVALAAFATWSTFAASRAASRVSRVVDVLSLYDRARFDVSQEESFERKYRLEPSPTVLAAHTEAGRDLTNTLGQLAASDADRRAEIVRLLALQETYADAIVRVFAAGDSALATRIDSTTTDPAILALETGIYAGADHEGVITDVTIAHFRRSERGMLVATPVAFVLGLMVLLVFLRISRNYQRTIETRAMRDALTGLPNRECFYERGAQVLLGEARRSSTTSVLVIDLDRFKEVNDTLGHRVGDMLLREVGPRITPLLRRSDTLARLGGDEFAVLLPDSGGSTAAHDVAERIIACLREPFMVDALKLTIDASCGHATSPDDGIDIDTLLQHADVAMYVGKGAHTDAVAYHSTLDVNTPRRLAILNELPDAIRDGQLVLHYQPKTDIRTKQVIGAEALVRWEHPTLGVIPPDDFIPPAEHTGLIKPLTSWVLDAALAQCRHWNTTAPGGPGNGELTVAVNVSARNLLDENFPEEVRQALDRHGVPPRLLNLEVTETAIMADPARAHATLQELHELGVEVSIDDFGTGYSSLSYLKLLRVDELKIDKSFVRHINENANDYTIVRSVIDLAHNLGLKTVAEGIEDRGTLDRLGSLGCDLAQGFYLARPMTAESFDAWLEARADQTFHPTGR